MGACSVKCSCKLVQWIYSIFITLEEMNKVRLIDIKHPMNYDMIIIKNLDLINIKIDRKS